MSEYQIAYDATTKTATVQLLGDALPEDAVNIGTFEHTSEDDLLGPDANHVLFHHVRDVLYKRSAVDPTETAMFPDNITDMSSITIVNNIVLNAGPVNTVAPAVTGTTSVNEVLTASNGTWSESPTFTYQWKWSADNDGPWTDIAGETENTYTVILGDMTRYLKCTVTATNLSGTASQDSNVVGPIAGET